MSSLLKKMVSMPHCITESYKECNFGLQEKIIAERIIYICGLNNDWLYSRK